MAKNCQKRDIIAKIWKANWQSSMRKRSAKFRLTWIILKTILIFNIFKALPWQFGQFRGTSNFVGQKTGSGFDNLLWGPWIGKKSTKRITKSINWIEWKFCLDIHFGNILKPFLLRYQKLLRANSQCAEEMRDQQIELPQTVEELQFLALQLREDLVSL